jgi:8-oxo-dGTP pyrophosphatase MutT (NUDIX family)
MPARTRYETNVCVLLHRSGRWLLSVRAADVDYAPGQVGLIGGHVEPVLGPDVLETTARREALEETGLDLTDVHLCYLGSELYRGTTGQPVLTVTFVGELPAGREAQVADRRELTAVGWWSLDELAAADVSPWLLPLVASAERVLPSASGGDRPPAC